MWVVKHYQKKEDCTIPMVAVSQPYCCAMGRMAMLMFTLSMLHNMKAMKHNPIMVQRRFHLLALPTTYKHNILVGAEIVQSKHVWLEAELTVSSRRSAAFKCEHGYHGEQLVLLVSAYRGT